MALALFHLKQAAHWNSIEVRTVDFSWKSPGTQLRKYCEFWSCLAKRNALCFFSSLPLSRSCSDCTQKQPWQHHREGQSKNKILWVVLSTDQTHQFYPLSVKSASGHCLKFLCLLQSLKFPQENSVCWARSSIIKIFLAFFGSFFSIPLYLRVSPSALWGYIAFQQTSLSWGITLYCLSLPCTGHVALCVCLIILVDLLESEKKFFSLFL